MAEEIKYKEEEKFMTPKKGIIITLGSMLKSMLKPLILWFIWFFSLLIIITSIKDIDKGLEILFEISGYLMKIYFVYCLFIGISYLTIFKKFKKNK